MNTIRLESTSFQLRLRRYLPRDQGHPALACAGARERPYNCLYLPGIPFFVRFPRFHFGELFI